MVQIFHMVCLHLLLDMTNRQWRHRLSQKFISVQKIHFMKQNAVKRFMTWKKETKLQRKDVFSLYFYIQWCIKMYFVLSKDFPKVCEDYFLFYWVFIQLFFFLKIWDKKPDQTYFISHHSSRSRIFFFLPAVECLTHKILEVWGKVSTDYSRL